MNGFDVNITESVFKDKPQIDQIWILFQGIVEANKCIKDIDLIGCEFSRKRDRWAKLKLASAIATGVTVGVGFIFIVWQITCK